MPIKIGTKVFPVYKVVGSKQGEFEVSEAVRKKLAIAKQMGTPVYMRKKTATRWNRLK